MSAGPVAVALDTGRTMLPALPAVTRGLRHALRGLPRAALSTCALGDPRCHLLQATWFGEGPGGSSRPLAGIHACGLDRAYELALWYYARGCPPSDARSPGVLLLCGDGLLRDAVAGHHVQALGGPAGASEDLIYTAELLDELLRARWQVRMLYVARGVYDTGAWSWEALLGSRNVDAIQDPRQTAVAARRLLGRRR